MAPIAFQTRVSIATKLTLGVGLLVLLLVGFLDVSAIFLLAHDKQAYVLEAQSNGATLAGSEFAGMARRGTDILRLALSGVNPLAPSEDARRAIENVVANQAELQGIQMGWLNDKTGAFRELAAVGKDASGWPAEPPSTALEALRKGGFALINLSEPGKSRALGIAVADAKSRKPGSDEVLIALGSATLDAFAKTTSGLQLTIASKDGQVLFDTDAVAQAAHGDVHENPLFVAAAASQVASGASEYVDSAQQKWLGSYAKPGFDLVVIARTEWKRAMAAAYAMTEKFILLGLMAVAVGVIFSILFAKRITAPIRQLFDATREVAEGHFDLHLEPRSRDEIGALTLSFNEMSAKIRELIEQTKDKVHLENELAIASTVQKTLLPDAIFEGPKSMIHSYYKPASQCGGDWWGHFEVGDKACLLIADATGHGLPSALMTASARSCFSVLQKLAEEDPAHFKSPSEMLQIANRVIHDASKGQIMMTFFIGVVDFAKSELVYASAGHNPPWLLSGNGASGSLKPLLARGPRLGESYDVVPFEEKHVPLKSGDTLFLYTDGLLEGRNLAGEEYGKKRARSVIESQLAGGPAIIVETIVNDFLAYNGDKPLDDDLTIAAAQFKL